MTDEQAMLKVKLDTAIDALRSVALRYPLPLDTVLALAAAEAHLRHHRLLLETDTKRG